MLEWGKETHPGDTHEEDDEACGPEEHAEVIKLSHLLLFRLVLVEELEVGRVVAEEEEEDGYADYDDVWYD